MDFLSVAYNMHTMANVPNIAQVLLPPLLGYSGDRDDGAL